MFKTLMTSDVEMRQYSSTSLIVGSTNTSSFKQDILKPKNVKICNEVTGHHCLHYYYVL